MAKLNIEVGKKYALQKLRSRSKEYEGRTVTVTSIDLEEGDVRVSLDNQQPHEFSGFVLGFNQLRAI